MSLDCWYCHEEATWVCPSQELGAPFVCNSCYSTIFGNSPVFVKTDSPEGRKLVAREVAQTLRWPVR